MERTEDFFKTHALRIKHRSRQRAIRMKLSVEAKVAAAVAVAFAALSIGAIAQEGSGHGTARLKPDEPPKIRDFAGRPERKQREPSSGPILIVAPSTARGGYNSALWG